MFNIFIQCNNFPDDLKLARVSPIFKDGDAEELGNYRPISTISAIARIFEKFLSIISYLNFCNEMKFWVITSEGSDHCTPLPWH